MRANLVIVLEIDVENIDEYKRDMARDLFELNGVKQVLSIVDVVAKHDGAPIELSPAANNAIYNSIENWPSKRSMDISSVDGFVW